MQEKELIKLLLIASLFIMFFVLIMLGCPAAFALAISSLTGLILGHFTLFSLPMRMFSGLDSYTLLAIPFYILMGSTMNKCGITNRLISLSDFLVGSLRSSLAQINILASLFLAGVQGSDIADSVSIGTLLIPAMKENGYSAEEAAVITAASSTIGPIFPPSITMVLYGAFTRTPIFGLFLAGVIPGILLALILMIITHILSIKRPKTMGNPDYTKRKIKYKRNWGVLRESILAIPIPVIIIGGIYGGFFTVTEAGVAGALYSLILGLLVYKTMNLKSLIKTLLDAALTTCLVGAIITFAYTFSYLLSALGFASAITDLIDPLKAYPILLIAVIVLVFFILGCFIPVTVILIIFSPFYGTLTELTGLGVYQFALVILLVLETGAITPPYGTILYVVSHIAKTSIFKIIPTLLPYLISFLILIILVILFPSLTMFIPNLLQ